ncbi:hypothetical protein DCS_00576 [Drechmeria coniospora]|uniref:Uncharacterized protein n=1 Tax=Drechmeria coniospora TaxID=98403 RepID=A0A151GQR9_DRECN|nr:hypothetical protein DCS_00576 [Drechmeria coniospora]KYK59446.1 hypothetical protein DCS_00576 [Drechmeria coniospora]ODA76311.1 hypothetical protein RJ55_08156 [Drechmeria coniospora]
MPFFSSTKLTSAYGPFADRESARSILTDIIGSSRPNSAKNSPACSKPSSETSSETSSIASKFANDRKSSTTPSTRSLNKKEPLVKTIPTPPMRFVN